MAAGHMSVNAFLQSVPLFAGLDAAAVSDLALAAEPFSAPADALLFRQNDEGAGVHLIETGHVRVLARTLGDNVIELANLGPGSVLGELSLLDEGRRSAAAQTVEPTCGWFISRARFEALYRSARPAAFELADRLRVEVARRMHSTVGEIARQGIARDDLLRPPAVAGPCDASPATGMVAKLRELRQFSSFSTSEAEILLSLCARADPPRGRLLAKAGDRPAQLFLVMRGAVRIGLDRCGQFEQLSIHGPGDMIGLCPLFCDTEHPASVDVREDAVLLTMPAAAFRQLRDQRSSTAFRFFDLAGRQMTRDLRRLSRYLGHARQLGSVPADV